MRRLIPFWAMPGSWGLRGKTREIAEAEYYLEGEELERRLIEINESDPIERQYLNLDVDLKYGKIDAYAYDVKHAHIAYTDQTKLERALLDVEFKHNRIEPYDFHIKCLDYNFPEGGTPREIAKLQIDYQHKKINKQTFERETATLKEEPYIAIIKSEYDPRQGMNGLFFEFDWNDLWIEYLRLNGYAGLTDEAIVEQWFTDICRSVAEENPEEIVDLPFNSGRVINRRRNGGKTEYS